MQPVVRALNVLRLLATAPKGLSLADIADRLSLPGATAHRIVAVLQGEQFVTRSATTRRYFLGPAARALYQVEQPRESPLVTPHEAIGRARDVTGETVFLSEVVADRVVCLALVESRHPLRLFVRIGQDMPLHAAAAARVLLAYRELAEVQRMLSATVFTHFTADTPNTAEDVLKRLVAIRDRGWDVCESELDENVWAVAAPVHCSTNAVTASVTIAAPLQRVATSERQNQMRVAALEAAAEMSADLGWNPA